MARQVGPDQAERVWYYTSGPKKGKEILPSGTSVPLYADAQCSLPADVRALDGSVIAGVVPTVLISDTLEVPQFLFPDVPDPVVYTRLLGGPVVALHPSTDARVDALSAELNQQSTTVSGKLAKTANLSDVTSALTARTNLGLGGSAVGELDSLQRVSMSHVTNSTGDEPGPVVCWTADDGYTSMMGYFDALNDAGIKGTLFLSSQWVDKPGAHESWGPYITSAEVQQIIDAGHEIGTHGRAHESFTAYLTANGDEAFHALVEQSKTDIEEMFPEVTVRTGAYCFGHYNSRIAEIVGRSHRYFRATRGLVVADAADPHAVPSIDAQLYTEAQLKAYVDQAVANRGLCIFLVHGNMTGPDFTKFANVMAYAAAQGCQQKPFYDAMAERSAFKSSRYMVDNSGNAFHPNMRVNRVSIERKDNVSGSWELDIDEVTSAPYLQNVGQDVPIEFRSKVILGLNSSHGVLVGRRRIFWDGVTTNGSAIVTSGSASFRADDVGLTVTGTGIPGGATILSVQSTTSVTLSTAATATATAVTLTLGRPLPPSLQVGADLETYGSVRQYGNSTPRYSFWTAGVESGFIDPTAWGRAGTGGNMLIDSGTGGSYITLKGFGAKLLTQDGSNTVTVMTRSGTPEGANPGQPVGSLALRTDGSPAAGVAFVKEVGATSSGWSAVQTRTGVYVKEGANARQGVATLVGGTATVANTSVTANSRIFLTTQALGTVTTPKTVAVTARIAGTSFTITSEDATDTSVVAFQICEPG
jgi:peptidoglycan/xylan/chitin deacetylase (PgdA/CDA1 family)